MSASACLHRSLVDSVQSIRTARSATTLADLAGPGCFFNPRLPYEGRRWLAAPEQYDLVTGDALCLVGAMPAIVSACATHPDALRLLSETGIKLEAELFEYRDRAGHEAHFRRLSRHRKALFQETGRADRHSSAACRVSPSLSAWLNNKESLSTLVRREFRFPREALPREHVRPHLSERSSRPDPYPCVVKVATDEPDGFGSGVIVCRDAEAVARAVETLGCDRVVIEDHAGAGAVPIVINFSVSTNGNVRYLGASRILANPGGGYVATILVPVGIPSELRAEGRRVAREAWRKGYVGFAAFDGFLMLDGSSRLVDLNFRIGAGLVPLVHPFYRDAGVMGLRARLRFREPDFRRLLQVLHSGFDTGRVLPISAVDPARVGSGMRPSANVVIHGDNADELGSNLSWLARRGFQIPPEVRNGARALPAQRLRRDSATSRVINAVSL